MAAERGGDRLLAIDLEPLGPVHVGARGVGIETTDEALRSDALYSALCSLVAAVDGREAVTGLLAELASEEPPWRLSSFFPRAGEVGLYPRPYVSLPFAEGQARDFKGMRFISEAVLARVLTGGDPSPLLSAENLWAGDTVLLTPEERARLPRERDARTALDSFWTKRTTPHVALDRQSGLPNLYGSGDLYLAPDCGYRLLAWTRDEASERRLLELLRRLGDEGIGGRRSSGHGHFRVASVRQSALPAPDGAAYFLLLSLYHPSLEELSSGLLDGEAAYGLVERSGWVVSAERAGQRWRPLRMFAEGSVLRGAATRIRGELVDVTPPGDGHRVLRAGIPLALPLIVPEARAAAAAGQRESVAAVTADGGAAEARSARSKAPAVPPPLRRPRRGVIGPPRRR